MSKYDKVINENGEPGRFVPDSANATIRTQGEMERAKYFASLPKHKRLDNGKKYVTCYHDPILEIVRDLSLIEAGAIVTLLLHMRFKGNGKLINEGKAVKKVDMQSIFKRGKKGTDGIVSRLLELNVLETTKDGRSNVYRINPKFHTMGERVISGSFTKLFQVKTRGIIDDLTLSEIGMLYKILPFFHYAEYYLCANPDADAESTTLEYMGRPELAKAIGHDCDTVTAHMNKLQDKGAILVTGTRKEVRYIVNPDVMFREVEETKWTWAVRKMFDDHANHSKMGGQKDTFLH